MILLGSTGSIGQNALALARRFNINVKALACKKNYKILNAQIDEFHPKLVYIEDESLKREVRHEKVFSKKDGWDSFLRACRDESGGGILLNALVGFGGLEPSIKAQELGFGLALANKESLVAGGKFLDTKNIRPIDSEHFGLAFLLKDSPKIKSLIITASGGAVKDLSLKELGRVSPELVLKHPNWAMGAKITTDSATMANKLFEILEAFWLYKIRQIDALIQSSSLIHALINFTDGSSTAHISRPDMKLAIAHALGLGDEEIIENLDILSLKNISFEPIDLKKYPIFSLKDEVLKNPDLGVIINGANEEMVYKFLNYEVGFLDISKAIFKALDKFSGVRICEINEVFELDKKVREFIKEIF